jgi:hypothetical protein
MTTAPFNPLTDSLDSPIDTLPQFNVPSRRPSKPTATPVATPTNVLAQFNVPAGTKPAVDLEEDQPTFR